MRGLREKVAVVTGAGGAIGRAISLRLADEGVFVGVLDRDEAAAAETVQIIATEGGRADGLIADITDYAAIETVIAHFEKTRGPIDTLVNNAGWDRAGNFLDTDPLLWERILAINLTGPLNLHHIVVRGMAHRGRGYGGEHFVRRRARGLVGRIGLRRGQGGHNRVYEDLGARAGRPGRQPECGLPRPDRYAAVGVVCRFGRSGG